MRGRGVESGGIPPQTRLETIELPPIKERIDWGRLPLSNAMIEVVRKNHASRSAVPRAMSSEPVMEICSSYIGPESIRKPHETRHRGMEYEIVNESEKRDKDIHQICAIPTPTLFIQKPKNSPTAVA